MGVKADYRSFFARLSTGALVADGALGTMLLAARPRFEGCLEELNLQAPEDLIEIHREYVNAGADIVQTNTFGANRVRLGLFDLADSVEPINRAGVELARRAVGNSAYAAGSVGPLGCRVGAGIEWSDGSRRIAPPQARAAFREQIQALVAAGSDLIVLETFSDLPELREALSAAREDLSLSVPLVVQFTVNASGDLNGGAGIREALDFAMSWRPDVVGCNCSAGPASLERSLQVLLAHAGRPVSAQPSAGLPQQTGNRPTYPCVPEDFGEWAAWALDTGVRIVGGCCGTTPEHVRAMRAAADRWCQRPARDAVPAVRKFGSRPAPRPQKASL